MNDFAETRFNLVTEPWMPVTMTSGSTAEFCLRDLFVRAHEIRDLSESSPLTHAAMTRFLLAILHRAIRGPKNPIEWVALWNAGRFDSESIGRYLYDWAHRFDLFDPIEPFAQVGPGIESKPTKPVTKLLLDRSSATNITLFDHSRDDQIIGFSSAEAARSLITAHAFGYGEGGVYHDCAAIRGYCILIEGGSLFQTLALNLQRYSELYPRDLGSRRDIPWREWKSNKRPQPSSYDPLGLTDLLTFQSRSIRLIRDSDGLIRRCWYEPGPSIRESDILDPFKSYSLSGEGKLLPTYFKLERALWRDSFSLLEQQKKDSSSQRVGEIPPGIISWLAESENALRASTLVPVSQPRISVTGVVRDQAKTFLWRREHLPVPLKVLDESPRRLVLRNALELAEQIANHINSAGSIVASEVLAPGSTEKHYKGPKLKSKQITAQRQTLNLERRYWAALDREFQVFLEALGSEEDLALLLMTWQRTLKRIGLQIFQSATSQVGTNRRWLRANAFGMQELRILLHRIGPRETSLPRE